MWAERRPWQGARDGLGAACGLRPSATGSHPLGSPAKWCPLSVKQPAQSGQGLDFLSLQLWVLPAGNLWHVCGPGARPSRQARAGGRVSSFPRRARPSPPAGPPSAEAREGAFLPPHPRGGWMERKKASAMCLLSSPFSQSRPLCRIHMPHCFTGHLVTKCAERRRLPVTPQTPDVTIQ